MQQNKHLEALIIEALKNGKKLLTESNYQFQLYKNEVYIQCAKNSHKIGAFSADYNYKNFTEVHEMKSFFSFQWNIETKLNEVTG
jgi:hypothetical protein